MNFLFDCNLFLIYLTIDFISPTNKGCGLFSLDLNSGWACVATKYLSLQTPQLCLELVMIGSFTRQLSKDNVYSLLLIFSHSFLYTSIEIQSMGQVPHTQAVAYS